LLEESAITETGTKLEGLFGSSNALVCKVLVPPDRKKLLVLDINGLLADFVYPGDKHQSADFKISGKLGNNYYSLSLENNCIKSCNSKVLDGDILFCLSVFRRPFCVDFLKFCFANFEVGVWSSRMQ
jgi:NLI interacting factor-like phosphatase